MGKLIRLPHPPKPKVPPRALLDAQVQFLADECASRTELLEGLPGVFAKSADIAPRKRRAELRKAICYIAHELDLTAHNLRVVLICAMVLFERFTAENAA
jgi:hypothetical protein